MQNLHSAVFNLSKYIFIHDKQFLQIEQIQPSDVMCKVDSLVLLILAFKGVYQSNW